MTRIGPSADGQPAVTSHIVEGGGCDCRAAGRGDVPAAWILVVLAGLLVRRRRR